MVEMQETATIVHGVTRSSLALLDEVGRGTSYHEGLALAQAVVEHLAQLPTRTLFATHFHELGSALCQHEHCSVHQMQVTFDTQDRLAQPIFARRIEPGLATHSFGVHIAELAGCPAALIKRAHVLVSCRQESTSEDHHHHRGSAKIVMREPKGTEIGKTRNPNEQTTRVWQELQDLDLEDLSPEQALALLVRWKAHEPLSS